MSSKFGGDWTKLKLDIVEAYLKTYLKALSNQRHWVGLGYIDAFAGTGSIELAIEENEPGLLDQDVQSEVIRLIRGSAVRALALEPAFDGYVFVDIDPKAVAELERLKLEYPDRKISLIPEDANAYLQRISNPGFWSNRRAVVFLDPAGMQVDWSTLEALARTGAVDVWIWFPLGVAVNRLLTRSGEIDPIWADRLDRIFGTANWRDVFYEKTVSTTLFGEAEQTRKIATPETIASYFIERLQSIFPAVAPEKGIMRNSKNNPIYSLCFASANAGKGGQIAIDIASYLLRIGD